MTAQSSAQLARHLYQHFNEGRIEAAMGLAADDVEVVLVPTGQVFHGREGFVNFTQGFHTAFPDLQIEVKNQVATEDQVVNEFVARGTHTALLMTPNGPVPPTGRPVEFRVCEVWGIRNGKVASLHNYQDLASVMRQLGMTA